MCLYLEVSTAQLHSFANTKVMHRPRSDFSLYFDIKNIYQISTEKHDASALCLLPATLFERWQQVCRVKITLEVLPNKSFVSTRTNSMKCIVNWIPANLHVCSNKPQPPESLDYKQVVSINNSYILVFGRLCHHAASTPITAGTHTSGVQ